MWGQKGRGPCLSPTMQVLAKGTVAAFRQGEKAVNTPPRALQGWDRPLRHQSQVQRFESEGIQLSLLWTPGRAKKDLSAPKPWHNLSASFLCYLPLLSHHQGQQLKLQILGLSFNFNLLKLISLISGF